MSNVVQSPIGGDREERGKVGKIKKKGWGNIDGGGGGSPKNRGVRTPVPTMQSLKVSVI